VACSYRVVDRGQRFLLPPDMSEWLPEGHLVWLVIDVVERLDTSLLHAGHANDGVGRRAYDPDMLLALLVYSYCLGVRSSRQIERLCQVDVAYRVICGNDGPDHTTIARFRQGHQVAAQALFVQVLALCAQAGLARVGIVAVDGTKMAANASKKANRSRAYIEAEVADMFAQARRVDGREDRLFGAARGDELPPELSDTRRRGARLDAALAVMEAARRGEAQTTRQASDRDRDRGRPPRQDEVGRAEANLERVRQQAQDQRADNQARARAAGRRPVAPRVHPEGCRVAAAEKRLAQAEARAAHARREQQAQPEPEVQANVTDPDSRIMKTPGGWVQGYNAQAAVSADGVILAAQVTQDHSDAPLCVPMMVATQTNLGAAGIAEAVGTMLFDAGYLSEHNLQADGPDRLIATAKSWKFRRAAKHTGFAVGPPPPDASLIEAMGHRLRSEEGSALYAMRQHTVEPVFGNAKHNKGFTRFMRRGLAAVDAEWKLIATSLNLLKLHHSAYNLASC
jgi:transposase